RAGDRAGVRAALTGAPPRQLAQGSAPPIYAVVDPARRAITVANAGHPPLLVGRSDNTVMEVHERGMVLGLTPHAAYANAELALRDGDLVLLYTDGVTEARNAAGEFFDEERLKSWLKSAN